MGEYDVAGLFFESPLTALTVGGLSCFPACCAVISFFLTLRPLRAQRVYLRRATAPAVSFKFLEGDSGDSGDESAWPSCFHPHHPHISF